MGTPDYQPAPVLLHMQPMGPGADVFACGCVLSELIERNLPFPENILVSGTPTFHRFGTDMEDS